MAWRLTSKRVSLPALGPIFHRDIWILLTYRCVVIVAVVFSVVRRLRNHSCNWSCPASVDANPDNLRRLSLRFCWDGPGVIEVLGKGMICSYDGEAVGMMKRFDAA